MTALLPCPFCGRSFSDQQPGSTVRILKHDSPCYIGDPEQNGETWINTTIQKHVDKWNNRPAFLAMLEALNFYADPDIYHAISIITDRPCGEFADDLDENHGGDYDRAMPGALARKAIRTFDFRG